ncbi:hypothetical protein EIK77_008355 [Talaromyces pinophilus]|nr:hypothetical protein EIK77_008355 [Talaromyces pinophilus]PCG88362.1 Hypothetical protein PENO1_110710 [Penicillium occitanis (nom. inval.)]PCG89725.1 hypothetical protein PENOC_105300 [Penicillium occitanis (nom. inval.)]
MSYHYFRTNRSEVAPPRDFPICLRDQDGAMLYEDDVRGLRMQIIKLNDVAALKQYIARDPVGAIGPTDLFYHDPYFIAAMHGSTDALRLLLETYNSNMTRTKSLDDRGISLLDIACRHAHIETARFLLDSQPPLGDVHHRNEGGDTALLHAASSLEMIDFEDFKDNNYSLQWVRDRIARSEDLIQFLLERGASARDSKTVGLFPEHYNEEKSQPRDTVLGLTVTRASYGLVRLLINKGADIHRKDWYQREPISSFGGDSAIDAQNVTTLHISSLYWNVDAIKALLDHGGSDMLLCRDSIGRLPLHWAAAGPTLRTELMIPESEIGIRIIDIFRLLLDADPDTINLQDKEEATALFYAVSSHAGCGTRQCGAAIRFLCNMGSNAGIKNNKGQTVLHLLAFRSMNGEPIDICLIELLLAHGANISSVDMNGNTALHIMAKNLRQVEAARFLISKGADVTAVNAQGNTPLHEVMTGMLQAKGPTRGQKYQPVRLADRLRAQDDMVAVIQDGSGYDDKLMDQPNAAGKTPRQLLEETRARWQKV